MLLTLANTPKRTTCVMAATQLTGLHPMSLAGWGVGLEFIFGWAYYSLLAQIP